MSVFLHLMSGENVWDAATKGDIGTLRERFTTLERSTYANPRMTMLDESVGMVAERAPPLIMAIIVTAVGILTPLFVKSQFGPLEAPDTILLGVVLFVFGGAGLLLSLIHI